MSETLELELAPFDLDKDRNVNQANPTQQRILEWIDSVRANQDSTHIPVLYIQGGVGCGKTRGILAGVIELLTEVEGLNLLWGRQDFKDLKLSIMNKFFEVLPSDLIVSKNETYHWYDIATPGKPSRIFFNGLKDLTGLGSQEFGVIVINEVHEISEQIYRALKRRCRQAGKPVMILMEGEAPNENHWLKKLTEPQSDDYDADIEIWLVSTYENWENLPTAYRGSLERMPESWKAKYLLGRFGFKPDGKPYYTGYKELVHSQELNWIPERDLICGWDFGFHHPACLVTQIDLQDRWMWLREIIGTDITIQKFGEHVKKELNYYYPNARYLHFGDPACIQKNDKSEFTSWQILSSQGINLSYRTSEYRQRKEIIERKLSTLINGRASLLVDKRFCKTANDGFLGGYHYPEFREGQSIGAKFEAPFKDGFYEHIMNAGEYIAVNLFGAIEKSEKTRQSYRHPKMNSGL